MTVEDQATVEEPLERDSRWWERLLAGSSTWIGLILVGLIVVFTLL